jgi:prolyl-tRNA synthetase
VGEDSFVRCATCDYAANVEAVTTPVPAEVDFADVPTAHAEQTPDTPTIDTLVAVSNGRPDLARADRAWHAGDTLKNVVFMVTDPDGSRRPLAIGLPGDREVDLKRLEAVLLPSTATPFEEADFAARPALVKGYIGPQSLGESSPSGVRYLVDPRVVTGTRWITGANSKGQHVYDLVAGRDFTADGTIDVAEVREGDQCPSCCRRQSHDDKGADLYANWRRRHPPDRHGQADEPFEVARRAAKLEGLACVLLDDRRGCRRA